MLENKSNFFSTSIESDSVRDIEIIETEMMLADLESIQKRLEKNNKKNVDEDQIKILEIAMDCINNNKSFDDLRTQFNKKQLNHLKFIIKAFQRRYLLSRHPQRLVEEREGQDFRSTLQTPGMHPLTCHAWKPKQSAHFELTPML